MGWRQKRERRETNLLERILSGPSFVDANVSAVLAFSLGSFSGNGDTFYVN
jgi:hypothetical protein